MKAFRGLNSVAITLLSLILIPLGVTTADAASKMATVILFDAPHSDLLEVSLDNNLITTLSKTGSLGSLVFDPPAQPRRWFIDAALIADVEKLAQKELVAQEWLARLKIISAGDSVYAIAFGHPDLLMAKRLAPSELNYYYEIGQSRLQTALGRPVLINKSLRWSSRTAKIPDETVQSYILNQRTLAMLGTVVPAEELDLLRSKLAFLLSSDASKVQQLFFARNAGDALQFQQHRLRIVAGKYRLTSEHEKVPITLVNDFSSQITLQLQLTALNSRIHVENMNKVVLLPYSKVQISVPVTVIASGSTAILAQFANAKGEPMTDPVLLPLNLSVISPAVAWFTTAAALLLFLGVLTQSVRRVRRARK